MCGRSPVKGEDCTIPIVSKKMPLTDLVKEITKDCLIISRSRAWNGGHKKKKREKP